MPNIELSQPVFDQLKQLAEPLVDNPDSVILKLIEHYRGVVTDHGPPSKKARGAPPAPMRIISRDRRRARKGEKTTIEEFFGPILQVLKDAGGKLSATDAIDRVGELMGNRLNEVDKARLPSGETRWRNTVRWASQRLKKDGKLDKKSWGTWKLAS